jgi:hypothetical protein
MFLTHTRQAHVRLGNLDRWELTEDLVRALATSSDDDPVENSIALTYCRMTREGQESFIECLQKNRGPTELDRCSVEPTVLSQALRGNSRLRRLKLGIGGDHRGLSEIFNGLSENKGLEYLSLPTHCEFIDDSMDNLCQALRTHPTLETLILPVYNLSDVAFSRQVKKQRICMLEDLHVQYGVAYN